MISLNRGYDVFGVRFDSNAKKAVHDQITLENINSFSKSKYTKALIKDMYDGIKQSLQQGKTIVCFGLPCENYAVSQLFAKYRDKMILVDLFCGGALNDEYFTSYLLFLEQKYGKKIENIDFRSKDFGTEILCTKILFSDGTFKYINGNNNCYISMLGSKYVRPSCHICNMGFIDSSSDLKIGDYFGSKKRQQGTSVVFQYSEKDAVTSLIDELKKYGNFQRTDEKLDDIVVCRSKKGRAQDITLVFEAQKVFNRDFENYSFKKAVKINVIKFYSLKQKMYFYLPYKIKKMVKK